MLKGLLSNAVLQCSYTMTISKGDNETMSVTSLPLHEHKL